MFLIPKKLSKFHLKNKIQSLKKYFSRRFAVPIFIGMIKSNLICESAAIYLGELNLDSI